MAFFWIALVKKINGKMQQMSNCYITFFCSFQTTQMQAIQEYGLYVA